ncbi:MAG: dephospho-CoA kinase [Bacteroidota bacterium]|nr:dephospho-CoA kinase [Bacteroidota bacterium]
MKENLPQLRSRMSSAHTANTLGVTGGMGSGKTIVCGFLAELGAEIFAADQVARELMEQPGDVRRSVERTFGPRSYRSDGQLDREWLAARVFGAAEDLAKLNAIVHPAVRDAFDQVKLSCRAPLLVHEAALIYEAGLEHRLDAVAVVTAPGDVRIRRVRQRDGLTARQVLQRMAHQLPQAELECRADVVVDNSVGKQRLRSKALRLFELAISARPLCRATFRNCRRL